MAFEIFDEIHIDSAPDGTPLLKIPDGGSVNVVFIPQPARLHEMKANAEKGYDAKTKYEFRAWDIDGNRHCCIGLTKAGMQSFKRACLGQVPKKAVAGLTGAEYDAKVASEVKRIASTYAWKITRVPAKGYAVEAYGGLQDELAPLLKQLAKLAEKLPLLTSLYKDASEPAKPLAKALPFAGKLPTADELDLPVADTDDLPF